MSWKRLFVHFFCMQKCLRILLHMQKYSAAFLLANDLFIEAFLNVSCMQKCLRILLHSFLVQVYHSLEQRAFVQHQLGQSMRSVVDYVMLKTGTFFVMALILLLDSSSPTTMLYTPCLEHMTVAIKDPTVTKPKYRLVYVCS